jgi:hypothetical protein
MLPFGPRKRVVRICLANTVFGLGALTAWQASPLEYDRDVRPILSENCFPCHGQDGKKRMAGLRLDSFEGATADRNGHAALTPGKPGDSLLYQRITSDQPAKRMPPAYSNRTLTADRIAILKRWIEEGGKYSKHWSFIPPQRPAIPQVANRGWIKQPIDAFVLARLEAEGLKPGPAAAPAAWLRRASLDLTGLPPTPGELDEFVADATSRGDAAYEAAVDRLLASPRYGERMTTDWLDIAHYADTHGFNNDAERSMWRWRDWVIGAFNANMPYDRFITEQLAGDLLSHPTLDQRIATGFLRNHAINSEGGIIEEEYRVEYVADRVRTLGMAWLGLTLECAHCHDHKFDPVTQRDHYRFFAFFNNVPELGEDGRVANAVPMIPAPTVDQEQRMKALEAEIARLERRRKPVGVDRTPVSELPAGAIPIQARDASTKPESVEVSIAKRQPMTFSLWLRPDADGSGPLLSAMDYAPNPASTEYGRGIELRLEGGQLEFRFADRFPAYSIRLQSRGAGIAGGKWTHIALTYAGAPKDAMRGHAAWVRIFADGRELPIRVLNDGLPLPDEKNVKPKATRFRIGWDNSVGDLPYRGSLDNLAFWSRALTPDEIASAAGLRLRNEDKALEALRAELFALQRNLPTVMVMEEMPVPRETHVLLRGAYNAPGEKVEPGVPDNLLGAWPAGAPKNRLGLARWLTAPDQPLTARVAVNRLWQQIFGQGLVKTSDNFGMQGEWPSHPELLDWLAREFVDSGWNVKALSKRMVLSATFRQDSAAAPELIARDPDNRLLARGPRFRLPAEILRDQALAISGLLKQRLGGPSVYPYQPEDLYKGIVVAADYPGTRYVMSKGDDLYRRSVYSFWKRTVPNPAMTVFDAPDREVCVVRRSATNTPLQALTLLNNPIFVEAARKLAERALHEGGASSEARVAFAFRLATSRLPDAVEQEILQQQLKEMLTAYRADESAARALIAVGESPRDATIPAAELAAYTAVANIILNLDEVITLN